MNALPLPQGVTTRSIDAAVYAAPLAYTVAELSAEFSFFTHGALFAIAQQPELFDPVGDWMTTVTGPRVIKQTFGQRLFFGLDTAGPTDWNRTLCGVTREHALALRDFLSGVCITDRENGWVYRVIITPLRICDPALVDRGLLCVPTIDVGALGIWSNRGIYVLGGRVGNTPALIRLNPPPEAHTFAKTVLADGPHAIVDLPSFNHDSSVPHENLRRQVS